MAPKLPVECFRRAFGASGAVFERSGTGRGSSRGVYLGGGVGRGVVAAVDDSDGAFDNDEEPELDDDDFFLLSPGLTIAICDGFVESAITTRAIVGPRTLV